MLLLMKSLGLLRAVLVFIMCAEPPTTELCVVNVLHALVGVLCMPVSSAHIIHIRICEHLL